MKKIAMVIGATSGIGKACAKKFAEVLVLATHQASGSVVYRESMTR